MIHQEYPCPKVVRYSICFHADLISVSRSRHFRQVRDRQLNKIITYVHYPMQERMTPAMIGAELFKCIGRDMFENTCENFEFNYVDSEVKEELTHTVKVITTVLKHYLTNFTKLVHEPQTVPLKKEHVDHPSHYNSGKIEVIDMIEDSMFDFHLGNTLKYVCRAGKKDQSKYLEDLNKALWYSERRLKFINTESNNKFTIDASDIVEDQKLIGLAAEVVKDLYRANECFISNTSAGEKTVRLTKAIDTLKDLIKTTIDATTGADS